MDAVRLGRYVILRHLATGGMADVMLARTDGVEGFERHVVVKLIRAAYATDRRFIAMFLDEARVAATLHHANIVQVHDSGEVDGQYYLAMEYIHGEDLRRILSTVSRLRTHLPIGHVLAIASGVAAGLHHAHERRAADKKALGIVHCDVSPSNILVGFDGSVKVVDFGITKVARTAEEATPRGKLAYMSPEQCTGNAVDRRSDIYSLGVVLYELATTTRLFKAHTDQLLLDAIVHGKVPLPRVRRPDLPNEVSTIIMRALAVDPARRYQTADELRVALDDYASRTGAATTPAALGAHIHKLFGGKVEPWLDHARPSIKIDGDGKYSWTEMTPSDGSGSLRDRRPTRTSSRAFAFEQSPRPTRTTGSSRGAKAAMIGLPLAAAAGVATWHFALRDAEPPHAPVASAPVLSAPSSVPEAERAGASAEAPAVPAPPGVTDTSHAQPATHDRPVARAPERSAPRNHEPQADPLAEPPAAPAPAPTEPPPAPVAPAISPAPAPVAPSASPAPAPPAPIAVAELSTATVQMIAGDHARQLDACSVDGVHGEVTVTFEIDAAGKVVHGQVGSTTGNPKVAACLLREVQSWQFPRPPAGAARGTYRKAFR